MAGFNNFTEAASSFPEDYVTFSSQGWTGPLYSQASASAVTWLGIFIALAFVALRTFYQYRNNRGFYTNDYLIFMALLCHVACASIFQVQIPIVWHLLYGDFLTLTLPELHLFMSCQYFLILLFITANWLVKFSLLSFSGQVFDYNIKQTKWVLVFWWSMCGLTLTTYAINFITQQFTCHPISSWFHYQFADCRGPDIWWQDLCFKLVAGCDIGLDFLIFLIPFPLLSKIQTTSSRKNQLFIIFCIPMIPICFGIVKLVTVIQTDKTIDIVRYQLFWQIENTMAIIATCLFSIRLFFKDQTPSSSLQQQQQQLINSFHRNKLVPRPDAARRPNNNYEPEAYRGVGTKPEYTVTVEGGPRGDDVESEIDEEMGPTMIEILREGPAGRG